MDTCRGLSLIRCVLRAIVNIGKIHVRIRSTPTLGLYGELYRGAIVVDFEGHGCIWAPGELVVRRQRVDKLILGVDVKVHV